MFKIKGPITFNAKSGKIPKEIVEAVKPIVGEKYGFNKKVEEPVVEEKAVLTKEKLEKYSFKELRKIGRKHGVKDRSRKGLIRELLIAIEGEE